MYFMSFIRQVSFMPPLKKRKKSANEGKDVIANKDKVETFIKPRFQQTVNSALHRNSKGQMKIPFVKSKPLKHGKMVEESSPIHNVVVPDTVFIPSSDFGVHEFYQTPGPDHLGDSTKNKKSDSCFFGEDNNEFLMKKNIDDSSLENEADSVVHHRKITQGSSPTCISSKLMIKNWKEIDNDISVLETYGVVISDTNEDVPSKVDEKEKKGRTCSEPSNDTSELRSTLVRVNNAEVFERNNAPVATNYSDKSTFEYSQSEKQALVSQNVCVKGEPMLGDLAYVEQHNSILAEDNVEQNQSRSQSDFRHQRNAKLISSNSDSLLESNDIEIVESRATGNGIRSSGSRLHPSSGKSIEKNVSEPKDKINIVAAVVVKILSNYHQSKRIANKVS